MRRYLSIVGLRIREDELISYGLRALLVDFRGSEARGEALYIGRANEPGYLD